MAVAVAETPQATSVDALLAVHPHLLDTTLPLGHFSPGVLWSDAAQQGWVEPDLRPFPAG